MPYKIKGKCVFRKDTSKKVGCTKGSVKKYLGALHTNVKESRFDKYIKMVLENTKAKYNYWKNCKEFEDGNVVQEIVQQDDLEYGEDTYYHNPEMQISKNEFEKMTDHKVDSSQYNYFAYNKDMDILIAYDLNDDRHDFYTHS